MTKSTGKYLRRHAPFDERYVRIPESGCWIWLGATNGKGYGQLVINGEKRAAHRYSYEIHVGPIPNDMLIMHRCDVRSCVNPAHLQVGTYRDNMLDMISKGRDCIVGERHSLSRLKKEQVLAIREDRRLQLDIAADYGVCRQTVSDIKRRVLWASI